MHEYEETRRSTTGVALGASERLAKPPGEDDLSGFSFGSQHERNSFVTAKNQLVKMEPPLVDFCLLEASDHFAVRWEGWHEKRYFDSLGVPTVGVGFNLQREDARDRLAGVDADYDAVLKGSAELTDAQVIALLHRDLEDSLTSARRLVRTFDLLPYSAQLIIVDMVFNLGATKFALFKRTRAAFEAFDYRTAAAEMRDSKWYTQVGHRSVHHVDAIERLALAAVVERARNAETIPLSVDDVEVEENRQAGEFVEGALQVADLALRLGAVERVTLHPCGDLFESDATHTVMLALLAAGAAADHGWFFLDPGRVAIFALVHDLVEAHAGDTNTTRGLSPEEQADKDAREAAALVEVRRQLLAFPTLIGYLDMYEAQKDPAARFVRYLDKVLPKLTHALNEGASLRLQGMKLEDVRVAHQVQGRELEERYRDFPDLALIFNKACELAEETMS